MSTLPLLLSTFAGHNLTKLKLMTVGAKTDEDQKPKATFKKEKGAKDKGTESENAEVQVGGNKEPVHEGYSCNRCQMKPIVSVPYKCVECNYSHVISIFFH